ncbi:sigma-70 family RNA polymerase sigma factor [Phycicoccus avicenniae]|uniref:sigma-70 family RNA polymerase sigma factor n=1 Tax=Phycicoccus avicenniae TaxID=2828860 RepID=UPI003D279100
MRSARAPRAPEGVEEYARAAGPRLLRFARSLTLHDADAEDLLQDTLVRLVVHWRRVERSDDPDRYVRRMMVNRFVSGRRLASARTVTSDALVEASAPVASAGDGAVEARVLADGMLALLDPRSRAVLVLRYLEDQPDEVVADVVGISTGNVRVIAHRALTRLRPLLTADELVP